MREQLAAREDAVAREAEEAGRASETALERAARESAELLAWELMIGHGVGVRTVQTVALKRLDEDFFAEED